MYPYRNAILRNIQQSQEIWQLTHKVLYYIQSIFHWWDWDLISQEQLPDMCVLLKHDVRESGYFTMYHQQLTNITWSHFSFCCSWKCVRQDREDGGVLRVKSSPKNIKRIVCSRFGACLKFPLRNCNELLLFLLRRSYLLLLVCGFKSRRVTDD